MEEPSHVYVVESRQEIDAVAQDLSDSQIPLIKEPLKCPTAVVRHRHVHVIMVVARILDFHHMLMAGVVEAASLIVELRGVGKACLRNSLNGELRVELVILNEVHLGVHPLAGANLRSLRETQGCYRRWRSETWIRHRALVIAA